MKKRKRNLLMILFRFPTFFLDCLIFECLNVKRSTAWCNLEYYRSDDIVIMHYYAYMYYDLIKDLYNGLNMLIMRLQ